jgi:hypothetical protein
MLGGSQPMGRSTATSSRFAAAWSQSPGHIVGVARLIKANVPRHVTRVCEIDEHEPAFCHALSPPVRIAEKLGYPLVRAACDRATACGAWMVAHDKATQTRLGG